MSYMGRHEKAELDRYLTASPPEQDEVGEQAFRAEVELGFSSFLTSFEESSPPLCSG